MSQGWKGILPESPGTNHGPESVTPSRIQEVARLVAQGYKTGEIAEQLGVLGPRARDLILAAIESGEVARLQNGRDETTKQMMDRRRKIAEKAFEVIQRRLNESAEKNELDGRDVNDAFRALDKTEHGSAPPKSNQVQPIAHQSNTVNVFSPDVLRQASENSKRIWESDNKC